MDFGTYPPEINSLRMYTGPGAAPMLTAAEAWDSLAAELHSVANSYQSVVSGLTAGPWQGPASESMSAAAASYVGLAADHRRAGRGNRRPGQGRRPRPTKQLSRRRSRR